VLITVTDGNANYGFEGAGEASLIQNLNVNMFAIGIGMAIDYNQLVPIASFPASSRVFQLQSYISISALVGKMSSCSCNAPVSITPGVNKVFLVLSLSLVNFCMILKISPMEL